LISVDCCVNWEIRIEWPVENQQLKREQREIFNNDNTNK
jgi:hypothetical protein